MSPAAPNPDDPTLVHVAFDVCDLCLTGAGGECHVPGCAFWMQRAPVGSAIAWLRERREDDQGRGRYDRAVEIVLNSGLLAPEMDHFWAFVDGATDEDELREHIR